MLLFSALHQLDNINRYKTQTRDLHANQDLMHLPDCVYLVNEVELAQIGSVAQLMDTCSILLLSLIRNIGEIYYDELDQKIQAEN